MSSPVWQPEPSTTRLTGFQQALEARTRRRFADYEGLHTFSVQQPDIFWQMVWDYTEVQATTPAECVLLGERFDNAKWFPGSRLNFAENLLRYRDDQTALIALLEDERRTTLSYAELHDQAGRLAAALKARGVEPGDRVAGYLPNLIETVVAMLATTWIGAIWSSCSPDFGTSGVCDRFGQIQPRVLFVADGYFYDGKPIDCLERVAEVQSRLPDIEQIVVIPVLTRQPDISGLSHACLLDEFTADSSGDVPPFAQLPFDHPLYVMYSSGTTGAPKCIVHGAGGTLIQHLKEHQLHTDLRRDDVLFYFTTCGWMMWNWLVSGLATGATLILYDGSPFARDRTRLLDMIDEEGVIVFGTSARYLASLEQAGFKPRDSHSLTSLRTILSTGSPLHPDNFDYVYRDVKENVALCSISGGTDIISCFVLGNPNAPIHRGEIQAMGLGMAVEIWSEEGLPVLEDKGELVCTRPFPSAPIGFWNDPDGNRYRAAYFERFPGVWAHGDYGEITANHGIIIHGRSDAVLNPGGVRIGTAEIYRQLDRIPAITDSVVIGQDWQDDVRVVLFVVLEAGKTLDDALSATIRGAIRANASPRHVPAVIVQVPDVPRTISGKVVELAVRNVVHGQPVKNTDALANPEALEYYRNLDALR